MTRLSKILDDNILQDFFKITDEDSKESLVQLVALCGGFEEGKSVILTQEQIKEKLNTEFDSVEDFNQKVLQKIYQIIRPSKSDGNGLVERKDMPNPEGLIENISKLDLGELLGKLGTFEEKKLPDLKNNVRIILNGATQVGCEERIKSIKKFIDEGLIPKEAIIDLATGDRDLWPDGIGDDSEGKELDSMLTTLLAGKTDKTEKEIVENISKERSKLINAYQINDSQLDVKSLSPKQKSDLRLNIIKNLKSEFSKSDNNFAWPQESEMLLELAVENFPEMSVISHNGHKDSAQGRTTGLTGLKKVAHDLIEEFTKSKPNGEVNLVVIAGGGHASRFSAILRDEINEIKTSGNEVNNFNFYPAGSAPEKSSLTCAQDKQPKDVAKNLLNLIEANLGGINYQLSRVVDLEKKPAMLLQDASSSKLKEKKSVLTP